MELDSTEHDERIMTLVAQALKMPKSERPLFIQMACYADATLYKQVSEVVAAEEQMEGFLDRPLIESIDRESLEGIFEAGEIISQRFEILRRIGEGGMGVVYEAYDQKRGQRIAIKVAKPGFGTLIAQEARAALQIRHRNVCLVNEVHTATTGIGDLDFLTMEFLDGETLAQRLSRGKLEPPEAGLIASQLCSALAEAHHSGVLHRDLKPGNVILCTDKDGSTRAVITDFGLAAESSSASDLEGGTPDYMAPELWQGNKATQESDVFSLGVILYEAVTGCKPFPALSKQNVTFPPPVAPTKIVKGLSPAWDKIIMPCLRLTPESRCSAEWLFDALSRKFRYRRLAISLIPSRYSFWIWFRQYLSRK